LNGRKRDHTIEIHPDKKIPRISSGESENFMPSRRIYSPAEDKNGFMGLMLLSSSPSQQGDETSS